MRFVTCKRRPVRYEKCPAVPLTGQKPGAVDAAFHDGRYSKIFYYEEIGDYATAHLLWREVIEELKRSGHGIEAAADEKLAQACLEKEKEKRKKYTLLQNLFPYGMMSNIETNSKFVVL